MIAEFEAWVNGLDPLWVNMTIVVLLTGFWGLMDLLAQQYKKFKEKHP